MARKQRYLPESKTLVHIVCRTIQGRFLFRPSPELNDIFLGVLGHVQRLSGIRVTLVAALSSHYHLLLVVDDVKEVADFMRDLNSKLAREVNRLTGWSGPVFEGRYKMIPVTNEERAQVEVFKYVLSQSCKENLVACLREWPGVHSVRALLDGEPLTGHWFDRKQEHAAQARGEQYDPYRYATPETVTLTPLPCWEHLSPEQYRRCVAALVEEIEKEAAADCARKGIQPLGVKAVLAQDPLHRPKTIAKSPAPFIHAATQAARQVMYEAYAWFVAAYREAAEKLGGETARFVSQPGASPRPCRSSQRRRAVRQIPETLPPVAVTGDRSGGSVHKRPTRTRESDALRRV